MTDTANSTTLNASQNASANNAANTKGKKTKSNAAPANKTKKPASKATSSHPKFSAMIKKAITELKDRNGSSKVAILKYILANFKVNPATANQHLKAALRVGTKNLTLKQTKGIGASGSFKLAVAAKKATTKVGTKKTAKKINFSKTT